ncbi:YfhO family protein [bacterium]|nr:YfhO family protein [bacterium]
MRSLPLLPAAFLAFGLLFAALFSPVLLGGDLLATNDALNFFYPAYRAHTDLWDPFTFGGFPTFADPQEMASYPPARILAALPGTWNVFVVLAFVLAATFTCLYVTMITESRRAGILSGLTFGMGGFLLSNMSMINVLHAGLWLPAILWGLEKLRRDSSPGWIAFTGFAAGMSLLAGHPQTTSYAFLVAAFYFAVTLRSAPCGAGAFFRSTAIALVLGTLLSAVLLLPAQELAGFSRRSSLDFAEFQRFSGNFSDLVEIIVPDRSAHMVVWPPPTAGTWWDLKPPYGYAGVLPLLLAAVAVLRRGRERVTLCFLAVAVLSAVIATGNEATAAFLYRIPVLQLFRAPVRHFFEFSFAMSVLAGIGLATLERERRVPFPRVLAGAGLVLFLLAAMRTILDVRAPLHPASSAARPAVWVQGVHWVVACALVLSWPRWKRAPLLAILVVAVDLSSHAMFGLWRESPARDEDLRMPASVQSLVVELERTHERLIPSRRSSHLAAAPPNRHRLWDVPSLLGYNPLCLQRVSDTIGRRGKLIPSSLAEPDHRGADLFAVRYLLVPGERGTDVSAVEANPKWTYAHTSDGVRVYENRNALPRAWITHRSEVLEAENVRAAIRTSRLPDGTPWNPRDVALLEEPRPEEPAEGAPTPDGATGVEASVEASVELVAPTEMRVVTRSRSPGLLVLGDVAYPGWRATVDGEETPVLRCDYVLRAVPIPAGEHVVRLRFRPVSLGVGRAISAMASLALLALVAWEMRRARAPAPPSG